MLDTGSAPFTTNFVGRYTRKRLSKAVAGVAFRNAGVKSPCALRLRIVSN